MQTSGMMHLEMKWILLHGKERHLYMKQKDLMEEVSLIDRKIV